MNLSSLPGPTILSTLIEEAEALSGLSPAGIIPKLINQDFYGAGLSYGKGLYTGLKWVLPMLGAGGKVMTFIARYLPKLAKLIGKLLPKAKVVPGKVIDRARQIGTAGKNSGVRVVANELELNSVFEELSAGGVDVTPATYNGKMVPLADGTLVGMRSSSKSGGATIDVRLGRREVKIHINQ